MTFPDKIGNIPGIVPVCLFFLHCPPFLPEGFTRWPATVTLSVGGHTLVCNV
jgi:hypothetical protein